MENCQSESVGQEQEHAKEEKPNLFVHDEDDHSDNSEDNHEEEQSKN